MFCVVIPDEDDRRNHKLCLKYIYEFVTIIFDRLDV
jgi:hypothetical protein